MEEVGPIARPVCWANNCVTKHSSHILCKILYLLVGNEKNHCWSTNDLLDEIERLNEGYIDEEWIVEVHTLKTTIIVCFVVVL